MEITRKNTGELTGTLIIKIEEKDYEVEVTKSLKKIKQKAQLKGFRPGKAPLGLIKKFHGKQVIVEEVNKILGTKIDDYIKEENMKLFGDLLPNKTEDTSFDVKNSKDFKFAFDFGLFPTLNIDLASHNIKLYNIAATNAEVDTEIEHYIKQNGSFIPDEVANRKSQLKVNLKEANKNDAEALISEEQLILIEFIKDKEIKKQFIGLKKGAKLTIDIKKAFTNETDLAALLKIEKEKLSEISENFEVEILEVEKFEIAELNQELFDKTFGKDVIKSEEELKLNFAKQIQEAYRTYSLNKFNVDAQEELMKTPKADLPTDFLLKWQEVENSKLAEPKTKEEIEAELPTFQKQLKWQIIKYHILEANKLKVSEEDEINANKKLTLNQFVQYGIPVNSVTDDMLTNIATESYSKLKDNEKAHVKEIAIEDKVFNFIYNNATVISEEVTMEEFKNLNEIDSKTEDKEEKNEEISIADLKIEDEKIEE